MKKRKSLALTAAFILAWAVMAAFWPVPAVAGDLNPSAAPAPTMRTLEEIYNKVDSLSPASGNSVPSASDPTGATAIHMIVEGANQGEFQGSCTAEGREGTIALVGYAHHVYVPRDPQSGQTTGTRRHNDLFVSKYIDRSSPLLFRALCTGENLIRVTIRFYRTDLAGAIEHYYTIELDNAKIMAMQPSFPNFESLSFVYERIKLTHEPSGTESEDSWPQ